MKSNKSILIFVLFLLLSSFVSAQVFSPNRNIEMWNQYAIFNVTNITSTMYCDLQGNCANIVDMSGGSVGSAYGFENYTDNLAQNISNGDILTSSSLSSYQLEAPAFKTLNFTNLLSTYLGSFWNEQNFTTSINNYIPSLWNKENSSSYLEEQGFVKGSDFSLMNVSNYTEYIDETEIGNIIQNDSINRSVNLSWDNLADIPAGFADGVDDVGGGGSGNLYTNENFTENYDARTDRFQISNGSSLSLGGSFLGGTVGSATIDADSIDLTEIANTLTLDDQELHIDSSLSDNVLVIDANGDAGASTSTGGALLLECTGNVGACQVIYSNNGVTQNGRLLVVRSNNPAFDQAGLHIDYKGVANSAEITHKTNDSSSQALNVNSLNELDTAFSVTGRPQNKAVSKFVLQLSGEGNTGSSAVSAVSQGVGQAGHNIYADAEDNTTGDLLNLRNKGAEHFVINPLGQVEISALANCDTIDTDANGVLTCGTDATGGGGSDPSAWNSVNDTAALTNYNQSLLALSQFEDDLNKYTIINADSGTNSPTTPNDNININGGSNIVTSITGSALTIDYTGPEFRIENNTNFPLGWTNLTNYPSACPAGTFVSQLEDSVTCTDPAGTLTDDFVQIDNTSLAGSNVTSNPMNWIQYNSTCGGFQFSTNGGFVLSCND